MWEMLKAKYSCLATREVINDFLWLKIPKHFTSEKQIKKFSMGIPVEILIREKTQIINNINPPYRHVVCLDSVKIIWYWVIFHMEQYGFFIDV